MCLPSGDVATLERRLLANRLGVHIKGCEARPGGAHSSKQHVPKPISEARSFSRAGYSVGPAAWASGNPTGHSGDPLGAGAGAGLGLSPSLSIDDEHAEAKQVSHGSARARSSVLVPLQLGHSCHWHRDLRGMKRAAGKLLPGLQKGMSAPQNAYKACVSTKGDYSVTWRQTW